RLPVGAEGHRPYLRLVTAELAAALRRLSVPNRGGLIGAGGGDPAAIAAPGDPSHPLGMGLDRMDGLALIDVPDAYRAIGATGDQAFAVRRPGDAQHVGAVSFEGTDRFSRYCIPEFDRPVLARRRDLFAVRL